MAMFPLPMERETISSLIIRGARMYGITNQDFCRYFLESKNPNNIVGEAKLAGAVHRALGDRIALWEILKEHTCFKYATAFLSRIEKAEMAEWIRQRSHCGSIVSILSGKVGSNDLRWRPVRFCPECVRTQEDEFGTSWWRTEWQIPGLELCLKHGCKLMSCGIKHPPPQALPSDISIEDCREADFGIKRPEDFAEGAVTLFEKLPEIDNIKHIGLIDNLLTANSVEHRLTELNYGTVKALIIDEMGLRVITREYWGASPYLNPKIPVKHLYAGKRWKSLTMGCWLEQMMLLKALAPSMTMRELMTEMAASNGTN